MLHTEPAIPERKGRKRGLTNKSTEKIFIFPLIYSAGVVDSNLYETRHPSNLHICSRGTLSKDRATCGGFRPRLHFKTQSPLLLQVAIRDGSTRKDDRPTCQGVLQRPG